MFDNIKEDYGRNRFSKGNIFCYLFKALTSYGFRAVMLYRMGHWFRKHHCRLLAVLSERLMHISCHCRISTTAVIGPGLLVSHTFGLIIGTKTRIGKNCDVRHNTTFGGNFSKKDKDGRSQPWVGDNVSVGVGAAILGPVKIGSNSIIGANSVVTRDVPENVIVSGVPAKVIKQRWDETSERKL